MKEPGHIVQYTLAYSRLINDLQAENNADFLAGYYLGVRSRSIQSLRFDRAEDLFDRLGKSGNGNPYRDHGDSSERVAAVRAGFNARDLSLQDAVKEGLIFVGYGR